ncbi:MULTISPECIES: TrmH family RNA methyltransferase [Pseudoalteromonas]|jgi:tRNA (guanosine-2'-O-)-methyltransferase|uniref:TrmH family RNA methyltransferase n=1 Tax=Pseudoalteromonas TaxID=53246 RepID=UPI001230B31D|nr:MULTISPECIES: RNA methyltransferase [Pseudoalteromonas]MBB1302619.1 RNA methyltransferase [Pseudoalteromonas sp. SR44-8]MBB1436233.1 RNA methyltransferase [Pseudoalteromonas sp. SG43-6]MBB1479055.1 RNA methyltransferase [Pseudoalteromonas sp. SG41-2]
MNDSKSTIRQRADEIKAYQCKNLIAVLENPMDIKNIGAVIRNANALGVEKIYVVDSRHSLSDDWEELRGRKSLSRISVSASKWTFVKRFNSTEECFAHLQKNRFVSVITSPHIKGKLNQILHEADYTQPKLAVWFGNESRGVSDTVVDNSEFCISIPMFGMIESLNLATTTGIVLYEITKQRREYQAKYKRAHRKP